MEKFVQEAIVPRVFCGGRDTRVYHGARSHRAFASFRKMAVHNQEGFFRFHPGWRASREFDVCHSIHNAAVDVTTG